MAMRVLRAVFVMAFLVLLSAAAPKNDTNTDTAKKTPTPTAIHTSTPTPTPAPTKPTPTIPATTPTLTPTPTLTIPPTSPPTTPPPLPSLPVNVMVASDAAANDNLGSSVAISDELIASGAPNHNTSGAVYVFNCVPTYDSEPHCSPLSEISPTDSTGGDLFGNSLAFLGANLVVIGAPNWSNNEGKVYIYNCASSPCTLATSLYNPNTTEDANFGSTVSVSGERVVIGAPDTNSETASGTAVIFTCTGSTPTCTQGYTIAPSGSPISAQFGLGAISQIESVTGPVIAVGALNYSSTGAVFLFNCNSDSSSCTQQTVLLASNANSGDQFGFSIAMTSSGSAPLTAIVGAIEYDNSAGAIYVFACNLPTCTQINNFQPSDVNQGDQFGYSLAIVESSLFVGSQNALGVGVVYAFDVSNFTNIVSVFTLYASDQTYSAAYGSPQFGNAIALDTTSQILVVTAPNGTPQGNAAVEAAGEVDAFSYIPVPVPSGPGVTPTQPHGAATDLSLAASITIICAFVTLLAPVVLGHS